MNLKELSKPLKKEMKMTHNKETAESNIKIEVNDSKSENLDIDNKATSLHSYLPKNGDNILTSVEVTAKVEESDSDDEPLIKKFEKEIKNLKEIKSIGGYKQVEKDNDKETKNQKAKKREKEEENKKNKKGHDDDGDDDKPRNNAAMENKESSSDDECLLDLVKKEYAKERITQKSVDGSSFDSDQPILSKSKYEFLKTITNQIPADINNKASRSTINKAYNASNVSSGNVDTNYAETVKTNTTGSKAHSNVCYNSPKRSEAGASKSKVQKTIKKTTNANTLSRKKNSTNSRSTMAKRKTKTTKKNKKRKITKAKSKTKARTKSKSTSTSKSTSKSKSKSKTQTQTQTKSKTKAKTRKKTETTTTTRTKTSKKSIRRAKGKSNKAASSKSKNTDYDNIENDSIVIGNFDPHNRSNKEKLVAQLLIRWWYVLPDWPPADYNYDEELKKKKLKLVPLEDYEDEEDVDENGFRKVYQISAFPGIFRDAMGTAYDLRDKDTCPCFNNLIKKSDQELLDLICQAIKNQLKCLKNSVYNETFNEKRLEKELKDAEAKLNKFLKKEKTSEKGNDMITQEQIPV